MKSGRKIFLYNYRTKSDSESNQKMIVELELKGPQEQSKQQAIVPSSDACADNMSLHRLNGEDLVPSSIIQLQQNEINFLRKQNRRLLIKIRNYGRIISHLRLENLISEDVEAILRNEMITADEAIELDNDDDSTHDGTIISLTSDIHNDSIHIKSDTSRIYDINNTVECDELEQLSETRHSQDSTADIQLFHDDINITSNESAVYDFEHNRHLVFNTCHSKENTEVIEVLQGNLNITSNTLMGYHNNTVECDVTFDKCHSKENTEVIELIQSSINVSSSTSAGCDINTVKCKRLEQFNEDAATLHSQDNSEDIQLFHCLICNKRFLMKLNLNKHIAYHYYAAVRSYECDICHKRYIYKSKLERHKRVHLGNGPYKSVYKCTICQKECSFKSALAIHMRAHSGDKPYECDICHERFTQKPSLTIHMHTHTGEKPYECDVCHIQFSLVGILAEHRHRVHAIMKT